MTEAVRADGVRFGRTVVVPLCADPLAEGVEALVVPANRRGTMGTGGPGPLRLGAGSEFEREAMERAPLDLGTALVTSPGSLAARGLRALIHAVVHPALGEPLHLPVLRRAVAASLMAADDRRFRSLAFLPIGAGAVDGAHPATEPMSIAVDEVVAHLRRSSTRLERILFVARLDVDLPNLMRTIRDARDQRWVARS